MPIPGKISYVTPLTTQGAGEAFATFRDPAGNVLGVFQEPG